MTFKYLLSEISDVCLLPHSSSIFVSFFPFCRLSFICSIWIFQVAAFMRHRWVCLKFCPLISRTWVKTFSVFKPTPFREKSSWYAKDMFTVKRWGSIKYFGHQVRLSGNGICDLCISATKILLWSWSQLELK